MLSPSYHSKAFTKGVTVVLVDLMKVNKPAFDRLSKALLKGRKDRTEPLMIITTITAKLLTSDVRCGLKDGVCADGCTAVGQHLAAEFVAQWMLDNEKIDGIQLD